MKRTKTRLGNIFKVETISRATGATVIKFEVRLRRKSEDGRIIDYQKRFDTQRAAEQDRNEVLAAMHAGTFQPKVATKKVDADVVAAERAQVVARTVADGLRAYVEYLQNTKAYGLSKRAANRILSLSQRLIGRLPIENLDSAALDEFIKSRLTDGVSQSTIKKEVADLRRFRKLAHKPAMGLGLPPLVLHHDIELKGSDRRTRRPTDDELERVLEYLKANQPAVYWAAKLALVTSMRQGELCAARWCDFDQQSGLLHLRAAETKTKIQRSVPLLQEALEALQQMPRALGPRPELILGGLAPERCSAGWAKACRTVGVTDLRFHDLRREAITRLAALGLADRQLMVFSGHKTAAMLSVYTSLSPALLGESVRKLEAARR